MSTGNKLIREYRAIFEEAGAKLIKVETGRKGHYKCHLEANGKTWVYFCGCSPSDRRAHLAIRADVRRMVRATQ